MSLTSTRQIEGVTSAILKRYLKLHIALLSALPSLVAAQKYHPEEEYPLGRGGEFSWFAFAFVLILFVLIGWWLTRHDQKEKQKQEEARVKAIEQGLNDPKTIELKDFYRRNYEATKLVYAEPRYVVIFNKYPEARRNEHLAEIAGFIDELSDIDRFIERLKVMPPEERHSFRGEAEARMERKVELLKQVYRDLD